MGSSTCRRSLTTLWAIFLLLLLLLCPNLSAAGATTTSVEFVDASNASTPSTVANEFTVEVELFTPLQAGASFGRALKDVLVDKGLAAIESLASARTRAPLGSGVCPSRSSSTSAARSATCARLEAALDVYAVSDADGFAVLEPPSHALSSVLKSVDTFDADRRCTVEPYDQSRLRVATGSERSVDLEPLLDPEARFYAEHAEELIVSADPDISAADFNFYSDPLLRVRENLLGLVLLLARRGLICFRPPYYLS